MQDAKTFLEIVAGERCPCGHAKVEHEPPSDEVVGETMGSCLLCDCRGVISVVGLDDE